MDWIRNTATNNIGLFEVYICTCKVVNLFKLKIRVRYIEPIIMMSSDKPDSLNAGTIFALTAIVRGVSFICEENHLFGWQENLFWIANPSFLGSKNISESGVDSCKESTMKAFSL